MKQRVEFFELPGFAPPPPREWLRDFFGWVVAIVSILLALLFNIAALAFLLFLLQSFINTAGAAEPADTPETRVAQSGWWTPLENPCPPGYTPVLVRPRTFQQGQPTYAPGQAPAATAGQTHQPCATIDEVRILLQGMEKRLLDAPAKDVAVRKDLQALGTMLNTIHVNTASSPLQTADGRVISKLDEALNILRTPPRSPSSAADAAATASQTPHPVPFWRRRLQIPFLSVGLELAGLAFGIATGGAGFAGIAGGVWIVRAIRAAMIARGVVKAVKGSKLARKEAEVAEKAEQDRSTGGIATGTKITRTEWINCPDCSRLKSENLSLKSQIEQLQQRLAKAAPEQVHSPLLAPYETSVFQEAWEWAAAEYVRKYPGAHDTVETLKSLMNQYLSSKAQGKKAK